MTELSQHMTDAGDDLNKMAPRTPPGMAYFIGTGPAQATCEGCRHFLGKARRSGIGKGEIQPGRCREYMRMMRSKGMLTAPVYKLLPETAACRHWEAIPLKPEKKKK